MQERLEDICARLCLLSTLERNEDEPNPLSRSAVRKMIDSGMLAGLVLKEIEGAAPEQTDRAAVLLGRASAVYKRLCGYLDQGYRVLMPDESEWPQALLALGNDMPLYLFAKGNLSLLAGDKTAVAGSRAIQNSTRKNAQEIGRILAEQGKVIVSGGAQGIDDAAAKAALCEGGSIVIVPALAQRQILADPAYRRAMDAGKMLLLCETPPDEAFSAAKALTRNHTIYTLGEVSMVLASRGGRGGSWAGAKACIKGKWSPVYALDQPGDDYDGNRLLISHGAARMRLMDGKIVLEEAGVDGMKTDRHFRQESLFNLEEADAHTGHA